MEHVALYRLFRPMNFDEIVEQEHAVAALRQSVISGKIGHAYLFCGTRGTGKTSIAKVFSRAINCQHPVNGNPCNTCDICKGVIDGSLLDVIEMDAASNNSVDNIRRICDEVMFMPAKAKYKVYIIDEVHMLSTGAFNALLKTLEEPPAHAVFLLATTEPHRIPATILSRCQRYDFRRISNESIVKRLSHIAQKQGISIEDDALSAIATIGDGALRDSVSLLDQVSTTSLGKTITRDDILKITGVVDETFLCKFATALLDGRAADVLPLCRELMMDGRDLIRFNLDLAQYFRNILVTKVSAHPADLIDSTSSAIADMAALGKRTDSGVLLTFISKLSELTGELKWSPSVRTSFEITMLRLAARGNKIEPAAIPPVAREVKVASVAAPTPPAAPSIAAAPSAPATPPAPSAATPAPAPVAVPSPVTPPPAIAQAPETPVPVVKEAPKSPFADKPVPAIAKEPSSEQAPVAAKDPDKLEKTEPSIPPIAQAPVVSALSEKKEERPVPAIAKMPEEKKDTAPSVPALESIPVPPPVSEEPVPPPETESPVPPPSLEDLVPPPVSDEEMMMPPPPMDEDFLPPPPVVDEKETQEAAPSAAELAATAPSSPNLHKAFAATHVTEGQPTQLAKQTRKPDVREPHIPRDIVMPDGMDAPATEPASRVSSNLQTVMHGQSGNPCEQARKEFSDYLMKNHTFEYMLLSDCKLVWKSQTVYCILPDSQENDLEFIRNNTVIDTNLLRICQHYEPSLIHVQITTEKHYDAKTDDETVQKAAPDRPEWVERVKNAAEKGNVTVTTIENM